MNKRILIILIIILSIITNFSVFSRFITSKNYSPINVSPDANYWLTVLLIPLDSRPPCTQFVQQLGEIAGIHIILPEQEILDHYKTPGDKIALRNWLKQESKNADAAIISVDMLVHGGLLASRLSSGNSEDVKEVLSLFSTIHDENPRIKLYVFNIVPRLLIADNQSNNSYQKSMMEYSVLKDQIYTFENPVDIKKLKELEQKIPSDIITRYTTLYDENMVLNLTLLEMVQKEILAGVVIGQDDGQPFGIPNMTKQSLEYYLAQHPSLANKVFITRGTDEVALTVLGRLANDLTFAHPRIYVAYSNQEAPQLIMPFMPHTVAKTVEEKIKLVGGQQVTTPDEADFILFVHVGTSKTISNDLAPSIGQLQTWLTQGYKVALVDLTENFQMHETIFPYLLQKGINVPDLIAYAGWNTTSNSIGTAVAQACLFTQTVKSTSDSSKKISTYKSNLEFLVARIIDDLYYQKEINPFINKNLQRSKIDPYNLDEQYLSVNSAIQKLVEKKATNFARNELYNHPIDILTNEGVHKVTVINLHTETTLPWKRTFEIRLFPVLTLAEIKN